MLENHNPATGDLLARIPSSTKVDVDAAVEEAKAVQPSWGACSPAERADMLEAIADALEHRSEEIAELESRDTGKPIALARSVDAARSVANFRFFADQVREFSGQVFEIEGASTRTVYDPVGICGLISPWNLPLYLLSWKVAPALAMGNTVVCKPSELTPMTANLLAEISSAILPAGVLNMVHGLGSQAGQALTEHKDVGAISFTGGTETGKRVASATARRFAKTSLELGGKNSTIVFADACTPERIENTLDGLVRSSFLNQGQICLCGSRLLIESNAYDLLVLAFSERVSKMKIGDPLNSNTQLGALINQDHRAKVEDYIALAKSAGGRILTGGSRPSLPAPFDEGSFLEPTVIDSLPLDHRCHMEEIFGPVVVMAPFTSEEEVISIANATQYGLSGGVWSADIEKANRIAISLHSGTVWINGWLKRDLRVPFGGLKASGVGREGGRWALEFFSEVRSICQVDEQF